MKATELRIGDLFYPINRIGEVAIPDEIPFRVLSIGKVVEGVMYNVPTHRAEMITEFNLCDVSPIPLTEEILLRLGFDVSFSSDPQEQAASKLYKKSSLEIHQPNEEKCYFITCINYQMEMMELKYVHQLQNLYYALTGEELILKE